MNRLFLAAAVLLVVGGGVFAAYTTDNHSNFSGRCQSWALQYQDLIEEAARLDAIYIQETASGSDPEFVDTPIATAAEHVDLIVHMREFAQFTGGGAALADQDRNSRLTPFLQTSP